MRRKTRFSSGLVFREECNIVSFGEAIRREIMRKKESHPNGLLRYINSEKRKQDGVKRQFLKKRHEKGIPERCDNPECMFYTAPLIWNGKKLELELDHKDGNRFDQTESNLQLLCPPCHRQQPTFGGRNIGRVTDRTDDGYTLNNKDGSRIVAATGRSPGRKKSVQS